MVFENTHSHTLVSDIVDCFWVTYKKRLQAFHIIFNGLRNQIRCEVTLRDNKLTVFIFRDAESFGLFLLCEFPLRTNLHTYL